MISRVLTGRRTTASALRLVAPVLVLSLLATDAVGAAAGAEAAAPPPNPRPAAAAAAASTIDNCPKVPGRMWCLSARATRSAATGGYSPAAAFRAYGPADLASAYRIPPSGSRATVAVVDAYDAPTLESDLSHYRAYYGLPACTTANGCFRKVNQKGAAGPLPKVDLGWAGETTLDVQMVSAVCPTCHILVVESRDDDRSGAPNMETAVKRATTMGARYVSMSWGGTEHSTETARDRTYLNVPGVTYVAAAGDSNYGTAWPAVSPAVVSVGGTTLRRSASSARRWSESVWGYDDGTGTGSGCSTYEPKPSWQAFVASSLCDQRAMNDVSIIGDPTYGVAVYQGGHWYQYGGTSAGSPMIAAMYAMTGRASGASPASYPYAHRANFTDVTRYANGYCGTTLCEGRRGWDGPTGVGTPIGLRGFLAPGTTVGRIAVRQPGNVTSFAGSPATLTVGATDSNGAPVTFSASGLPAGTSMRSDGRVVGTARRAHSGVVTVRATDVSGGSASRQFRWTVVAHTIKTSQKLRITGKLRPGRILTARFGTFRRDASTGPVIHPRFHRHWYVGDKKIKGAVHKRFKIRAAYRHRRIAVRVTASKPYYTKFAASTRRHVRVH